MNKLIKHTELITHLLKANSEMGNDLELEYEEYDNFYYLIGVNDNGEMVRMKLHTSDRELHAILLKELDKITKF